MAKKVELNIFDISGNVVKKIDLNEQIFNSEINDHAVYRAVCAHNANKRRATAKTKNRSEVRGGGKKPWRQKGTGRARAGSIRSPIWVGGGKIFTPTGKQNFKIKQNKKEYLVALRSVLADKASINNIRIIEVVVDDIPVKKTADLIKIFNNFNIKLGVKRNKTLFIVEKYKEDLFNAANNIKFFKIVDVNGSNVFNILDVNYLFLTMGAMKVISDRLLKGKKNYESKKKK